MKQTRIATFTIVAFVLFVFCANAYRLHFGIEISDESYYIALAYRFVLGDQPLVDEFSLHQGAALLTYPALKLFLWLFAIPDGIVLFTRYLHLVFTGALAALVFFVLRKTLDWRIALLVAAQCVAFVPFNMHNLGYNTLGSGLLTAALCMSLLAIVATHRNLCLFASGLFNGLAVVSYPTLVVPAIVAPMLLWFVLTDKRSILAYCVGEVVILCGVLPLVIAAGPDQIRNDIASFLSSYGPGTASKGKVISSVVGYLEWLAYHPIIGKALRVTLRYLQWFPNDGVIPKLVFLGVLLGLRSGKPWARYGLLATPLLMFPEPTVLAALSFVRNYALLAPFLFYFLWQDKLAKQMFYVVWLPAFVASLITSWSSGNGADVAAVGFFPGSLVTAVYSAMLVQAWLPMQMPTALVANINQNSFRPIQALPALWALAVLVVAMGVVFRDSPISELDTKIVAGPYKGIFTTKSNKDYLDQLLRDLSVVMQPGRRILYYAEFPAGYLFSTMRPATNGLLAHSPAVWPGFNIQSTLDYYVKFSIEPDIVVLIRKVPMGSETMEVEYLASDPLYKTITGPAFHLAISREQYSVYLRK